MRWAIQNLKPEGNLDLLHLGLLNYDKGWAVGENNGWVTVRQINAAIPCYILIVHNSFGNDKQMLLQL